MLLPTPAAARGGAEPSRPGPAPPQRRGGGGGRAGSAEAGSEPRREEGGRQPQPLRAPQLSCPHLDGCIQLNVSSASSEVPTTLGKT